LLEALAKAVVAVLSPSPRPLPDGGAVDAADFLTAGEFARRLGVSRETVRRLAIAGVLPHTVVCRGARQTTRRFPRRFADDFAASGTGAADLAGFAVRWRAQISGGTR
jgi:excisionase family DNA binding protein